MLDRSRKPKERHVRYLSKTVEVVLLLDMSGSMDVRRNETIREINRYLNQLKGDGNKYRLTVKTFNTSIDTLISHKDIRDVGELEYDEYRPSGWTALLDAVGSTLSGYRYRDHDRRCNKVLFCVVTDGAENSSRNYGLGEVRDIIDDLRSEDFQFVFLGDGPGAWQVGSRLGFNYSINTDWTSPNVSEDIYKSLYTASATMSSGAQLNTQVFNTNSTSASNTAPTIKSCDCLGVPNNINGSCPIHGDSGKF